MYYTHLKASMGDRASVWKEKRRQLMLEQQALDAARLASKRQGKVVGMGSGAGRGNRLEREEDRNNNAVSQYPSSPAQPFATLISGAGEVPTTCTTSTASKSNNLSSLASPQPPPSSRLIHRPSPPPSASRTPPSGSVVAALPSHAPSFAVPAPLVSIPMSTVASTAASKNSGVASLMSSVENATGGVAHATRPTTAARPVTADLLHHKLEPYLKTFAEPGPFNERAFEYIKVRSVLG